METVQPLRENGDIKPKSKKQKRKNKMKTVDQLDLSKSAEPENLSVNGDSHTEKCDMLHEIVKKLQNVEVRDTGLLDSIEVEGTTKNDYSDAAKKSKKKHKNKKHKVLDAPNEKNTTLLVDEIAGLAKEVEEPPKVNIEYKEYESELEMPDIMHLIQKDLSEPYSIYTYRYFIHNWPNLCFLATHGTKCVGAIVCKLDMHKLVMRGYIAMLAVDKDYRKLKIGTTLVEKAIKAMLCKNADEVVLETEITNFPALRLYENLGFVRDKRLFHYYLNGVDALRLKLWFR